MLIFVTSYLRLLNFLAEKNFDLWVLKVMHFAVIFNDRPRCERIESTTSSKLSKTILSVSISDFFLPVTYRHHDWKIKTLFNTKILNNEKKQSTSKIAGFYSMILGGHGR